jgi:hypothetical protein
MAGEKNLIFLLDYSGSMFSKQVNQQGVRRIDILKDKLYQFLKQPTSFTTIEGYCFASTSEHLGNFVDAQSFIDTLKNYDQPMGGRTNLWDALGKSIDDLDDDTETIIVCITDGEDTGSGLSYQDVLDRSNNKPNLKLHILDIEGTLKNTLPNEPVVTMVDDLEQLDADLGAIVEKKIDLSLIRPAVQLPISVPLVNLVPCDKDIIDLVVQSVRNAVGYLEGLTGLRYYPVTTFVIDKLDRRRPKKIPLPDPELFEVITEMLDFLNSVCLTFHMGCFTNKIMGDRNEPYGQYSQLDEEIRKCLVSSAEALVTYFHRYLKTGETWNPKYYYINGLHSSKNPIVLTRESLEQILVILKNIERTNPSIGLKDEYFHNSRYFINEGLTEHYTQLYQWKPFLSEKEHHSLVLCNWEGVWIKGIRWIVKAMAIIIPAVFRLIYQYRAQSGPYSEILRVMHLWGVYFPPESQEAEKLLLKKNFPYLPAVDGSGKVFLCLNTLRESFQKLQESKNVLGSSDFADFLLSVIVHEHTHAITTEGIGTGEENISCQSPRHYGKRTELVSEALAEWAELNYFRNNELLYELIFTHANLGPPSEWPYAGALFFEKKYSQETGDVFFRSVLNTFRQNGNKAYRMLIEKPVLQ